MVNSQKGQFFGYRDIDDMDQLGTVDSVEESSPTMPTIHSEATEVVEEVAADEGVRDLLNNRGDNVLQWLQALDMQVMGACRSDERLKPLLKLNISTGAAEERLLSQLTQHFDPSEVGILARCLSIPLVSIRVGKITKHGSLLCPTSARGSLNVSILPSSDLRFLLVGDDGCSERLATLNEAQCSAVEVGLISADKSGRSFFIKNFESKILYFWCSEKSKLLGDELLRKMKDLLRRKPSLSGLTGISKARLDSFAVHLRAYLLGSTVGNACAVLSTTSDVSDDNSEVNANIEVHIGSSRSSRFRQSSSQGAKSATLYQNSLSPRSTSFKECPRNPLSSRSVAREKLRKHGDCYVASLDNPAAVSPSPFDASCSSSSEDNKFSDPAEGQQCSPSALLESLVANMSFLGPAPSIPSAASSVSSPYYCWCPPAMPSQTFPVGIPQLPISSDESLTLPSLSTLVSAARSSAIFTPRPQLNLAEVTSMDFPPLLPEPVVKFPFSVPASQHICTFTPLMCDSIVHIPVIDVCSSSGQAYLVSTGPTISSTITPLHPLIPEAESVVEKGARETLRLLIGGSSQPNSQLMDVLPSVFMSGGDEKLNMLAAVGSRGMYTGTRDIGCTTSSLASLGLLPLSKRTAKSSIIKSCISKGNPNIQVEHPDSSGGFSSDSISSSYSNLEESTD